MELIKYSELQMRTFTYYGNTLDLEKYTNNTLLCCLHITKETGVLIKFLHETGFKVELVASNPLSTNEQVKKELLSLGVNVYSVEGDYNILKNMWSKLLKKRPDYIIDDGGDLVDLAVACGIKSIKGCCEETTTGVTKELIQEKRGNLFFPVIAVNNARTKNLMDNHFGTAQSVLDGIIRSTQEIIAGKNILICGYGHCGSGLASRARGLGANVSVSEIDPIKTLQAYYDGYSVGSVDEMCKNADIIISATGCINTVGAKQLLSLKDNCILTNAGHSDCEIDVNFIKQEFDLIDTGDNFDIFKLNNKSIILLGKGRIINLVAANGHPSEIMSLSYSSQMAGLHYLLTNNLSGGVHFLYRNN